MNKPIQKKILVIDDSVEILNWFLLLNSPESPYHFQTLQNEINIANALEEVKPVLVFLDISLNTLDGPLVATILNGNGIPNSQIISMSASAHNRKSIDEDNFLQKPLTKEMVFEKIKKHVK